METFDELFNIVKAIGEILPEGENTLNLGSVKLEVDKKDNSIKIQIVDNGAMDLVKEVLETIRPMLQRDGGDIEFVELTEDNIVKVKLQGHCAGCPGAQMTIKGVVERLLKESYPEIQGVESV